FRSQYRCGAAPDSHRIPSFPGENTPTVRRDSAGGPPTRASNDDERPLVPLTSERNSPRWGALRTPGGYRLRQGPRRARAVGTRPSAVAPGSAQVGLDRVVEGLPEQLVASVVRVQRLGHDRLRIV